MNHRIAIRRAIDRRHLEEIQQLAHAIWREHYPGIISPEQIEYMLQQQYSLDALETSLDDRGIYYDRALADLELIGFSAFGPLAESEETMLYSLYVRRDFRRSGCGRKLLDRVVEYARTRRSTRIALTVNKRNDPAIEAYRHYGFRIRGPIVTDIGGGFVMDDHRMELDISAPPG